MTAETPKQAYNRGYHAGRKRARRDRAAEQQRESDAAFWDRAFLAALPACIRVDGWKDGEGKPINTLHERIDLAKKAAHRAARVRAANRWGE